MYSPYRYPEQGGEAAVLPASDESGWVKGEVSDVNGGIFI
jgi:hypothetical protein